MLLLRRLCVATAFALASAAAPAFGPGGHQAVGALADQLLAGTPTGKKVRKTLGGSLQQASAWADCARAVELVQGVWTYTQPGKFKDCAVYENPASEHALIDFVQRNATRCGGFSTPAQCRHKNYHFVDLPIQRTRYDPAAPGTGDDDLVQAINACIVVLKGGKSPAPFRIASAREALRLLAHYVGDIHQPLHVGAVYLDDDGRLLDPATPEEAHARRTSGGNQITLEGKKLHAWWDDVPEKITRPMLAGSALAQAKKVAATRGAVGKWAATWAGESTAQAAALYADLRFGPMTVGTMGNEWPATAAGPATRQAREAMQQAQLLKGGARLAQVLKAVWP
jgi:S1/P1 Nuclease